MAFYKHTKIYNYLYAYKIGNVSNVKQRLRLWPERLKYQQAKLHTESLPFLVNSVDVGKNFGIRRKE